MLRVALGSRLTISIDVDLRRKRGQFGRGLNPPPAMRIIRIDVTDCRVAGYGNSREANVRQIVSDMIWNPIILVIDVVQITVWNIEFNSERSVIIVERVGFLNCGAE